MKNKFDQNHNGHIIGYGKCGYKTDDGHAYRIEQVTLKECYQMHQSNQYWHTKQSNLKSNKNKTSIVFLFLIIFI